jgi:hypothetical protein
MSHGFRSLPNMAPSSAHAALASYLGTAYPLGAHTALGAVKPLVGQDVAWVFQPYLALLASFTALSIYAILAHAIPQRGLRALAAFVAAQSGLVYAYFLEASIKEIATICLIAMLVAVGADYVVRRGGLRAVVPLAVVTAAGMGVLNASILPWLGPILLAVLIALLAARGFNTWRAAALDVGAFVVLAAALSFPALAVVNRFINDTTAALTGAGGTANQNVQFGNLFGPLSDWHAFGIWPTGDFRLELQTHVALTYGLIGLMGACVVIGLVWALRRGSGWPLVFVGASAVGWAYITARSTPWGDAKALMIVSPAVVTAGMMAPASLWGAFRRPEALFLAALLAFGVLWTNAVAYHDADLAPRARLAELDDIGHRFAGRGPTLYTEFEEFGKHFLHEEDPSGSDEAWQDSPRGFHVDGSPATFGYSSEIDALAPAYVQHFKTLVLRRSPSASRPPSNYRLAYRGTYYDVWTKAGPPPVKHLALGDQFQPAAVPACTAVRKLSQAGGSQLAYVERPRLPFMSVTEARHPSAWHVDGGDPNSLRPVGAGTVSGSLTVDRPGSYAVWVQGSFGRPFTVIVDGHKVGQVKHELNPRGQFALAGDVNLAPGRHSVVLVRPGGNLYPGDGGRNRLLGPVVLDPAGDVPAVHRIPASDWRELCERRLDWIESVR